MQLVFHVGMGKTGTSSIQAALRSATARLAARGMCYLGMWFDMLDPRYGDVVGQSEFLGLPPEKMASAGRRFADFLAGHAETLGLDSFIMSNEALASQARPMTPLLEALAARDIDVRIVGYVRNPASWLPSAHVQWSIRDKVPPGPIRSYGERARILMRYYEGPIEWAERFGDQVEFRSYEVVGDIVRDFTALLGVDLGASNLRVLERGDDAEILLRALFNNRFPRHTLPRAFDQTVLRTTADIPRIAEMARRCFDYAETDAIIAEAGPLFDRFRDRVGFDPRDHAVLPAAMPDEAALRERLTDLLTELTLQQAQRIAALEAKVAALAAPATAGAQT